MFAFEGGRDDYGGWVVYTNEVCADVKILGGRPEMQSGSRAANGRPRIMTVAPHLWLLLYVLRSTQMYETLRVMSLARVEFLGKYFGKCGRL